MPRPMPFQEDFWVWGWDNSGVFSIESAYWKMVNRNTLVQLEARSSCRDETVGNLCGN
jgi:hypothetical protein